LNFDACQWWQTRGASSVLWCLRYAFVLSFVETCRTVSGVKRKKEYREFIEANKWIEHAGHAPQKFFWSAVVLLALFWRHPWWPIFKMSLSLV
jgi:hypothetical protein